MKPMIKKALALLPAAIIMLAVASCGGKTADLTDPGNYLIKIEGTAYAVGDPFSKLAADFEISDWCAGEEEHMVAPDNLAEFIFDLPNGQDFKVLFENPSEEEKKVKDCTVGGFEMVSASAEGIAVSLTGELRFDVSTPKNVKALLGEPDEIDDRDTVLYWEYKPTGDRHLKRYRFMFAENEAKKMVLWSVDMRYMEIDR